MYLWANYPANAEARKTENLCETIDNNNRILEIRYDFFQIGLWTSSTSVCIRLPYIIKSHTLNERRRAHSLSITSMSIKVSGIEFIHDLKHQQELQIYQYQSALISAKILNLFKIITFQNLASWILIIIS